MTEEHDSLSIKRVFVTAAAAFTAIGILRGSVQLFAVPRELRPALYLYRLTILISWFWIPVALGVAATWRWRRIRWRFIGAHLALVSVAVFGEVLWMTGVISAVSVPSAYPPFSFRLVGRLDTNLLIYAAIVGAVWAADSMRRESATRLAAARLDSLLADTRLHVLTLQLHPHFLFNTLNLISQLAYRDAAAARRTLDNLRRLLVESLSHAGRRDVPLRDELRFLGAYLEIQQRRFGDRLRVRTDITAEALDAAVPQLLLQPIVENAIIHGLANKPDGGELRIAAHVAGNRLVLSVEDDGLGVDVHSLTERVGLTNTRLRLQQFAAGHGDYRFSLSLRPTGGIAVTIVVPRLTARDSTPADHDANVSAESEAAWDKVGHAPRPTSRVAIGVQIVAGWAAVAVLWTELAAAQQFVRHVPIVWGPPIKNSVVNALILALLTPGVLWVARRLDIVVERSWRNIAGNAVAALGLATLHLALLFSFLHRFVPSEYAIEIRNVFGWAVWDIVAYATIVAFGMVATLAGRHRDTLIAMTDTRSRIANARLASLRLRLQPAVLLRGLDAIGHAMSVDPERAEHAIARMGDLLRSLLSRVDRDSASLDIELGTLCAFLDVVNPGVTLVVRDEAGSATVPAGLLTPLAAALDGLASISVRAGDAALDVRLQARGDDIDNAQLAQVRARVQRRYGPQASLSVDVLAGGGVDVRLRVPLGRSAMSEDDEPVFEPALGVA